MSPDEIRREIPDLPCLVDGWQLGTLDDASQQRLSDLLQSRSDARRYFLEQCQIDAELRWRFGSQQQMAGTLACQEEGEVQPIAVIVLSGMGFRDDRGFPEVFDKVEPCEPLAREWLQVYLTLRACVFLVLPRMAMASAVVEEICRELARHRLTRLTRDEFRHLAGEVTCRLVGRRLQGRPRGVLRNFASVVRRCLECAEASDVVAIYESFEALVPRHLPADILELLARRYLLEQSPEAIATALDLPVATVRARLVQGRMLVLKSCVPAADVGTGSRGTDSLGTLASALDGALTGESTILQNGLRVTGEGLWQEVGNHTKGSEKCRHLLTLIILHEALYRRLSLQHLLEVSKTRKDEGFHLAVTEMVRCLEQTSVENRRLAYVGKTSRWKMAPAAWAAAIAASLLIVASTGLWRGGEPASDIPSKPLVADIGPPHVKPSPPEPVVPPTVVAEVRRVLQLDPEASESIRPGAVLYADHRVEFAAGIVHLTTPSGSEWVLEGPVSATLRTGGEIHLASGKLVGLNKGAEEVLVVETPTARVLDKGTEFGVGVVEGQTTSVAVYEGAVELSPAGSNGREGASHPLRIEADYEAVINQGGEVPREPTRSVHDRTFIRPDEVALREEQQRGSVDAAQRVAFFELLRVEGLLAYQGFHRASQGRDYAVGFLEPRSKTPQELGADLRPAQQAGASSGALQLSNGETTFLDLDLSQRSRFQKEKLVDATGFVGGRQTELWVCWRSKTFLGTGRRFNWAGVSLMHGDSRQSQEPAFIGQPAGTAHLGLQIFNADAEVIQHFDTDPNLPEAQMIESDDRLHRWIVRVRFDDSGSGTVAAWVDVDPTELDSIDPYGEHHVDQLKFDRLRLEVSPEGDSGQCAFDEIYLTTSLDALVEAMARCDQPVQP